MNPWSKDQIGNLEGKKVIITGASSGIGFEAAKVLASKGAEIVMAVRNIKKGEREAEKIKTLYPEAILTVMHLNLNDLADVNHFAQQFRDKYDRLDILINNAGIMVPPYRKTKDGFESQFGTNYLGHFALTGLLMPVLLATPLSRVVTTSSIAARKAKIRFDNLDGSKGYERMRFYRQSKLACLLFGIELQQRLERADTSTISVVCHPGISVSNLVSRGTGKEASILIKKAMRIVAQPAAKGALPSLYAATFTDLRGGEYIGPDGPGNRKGNPVQTSEGEKLFNKDLSAKLWDVSENLTGVKYSF
ncbi:MAG: oxidoreductase [Bacteroidales bacterium]